MMGGYTRDVRLVIALVQGNGEDPASPISCTRSFACPFWGQWTVAYTRDLVRTCRAASRIAALSKMRTALNRTSIRPSAARRSVGISDRAQ